MNYNNRCTVFFSKKVPGYLGEDEVETEIKIMPYGKSFLSDSEQMNLFGKYNKKAFKVHLQGTIEGIAEIEFEGLKRNIFDQKFHRNSTVVIVS
ncbi:hypothetical protein CUN19_03890 [Enterococcus faecium]|uniref:hypothetical protein n=1 Tax=Enterococcus faecium TaxID=1352 RepID=UPI000CF2813C|nr:hypothetical protein [Enterococcus faecium]EGP5432014.1 hypothetical protein [Enterococcus faecium]EME8212375.1 hypothetical protein [Enterococcus faecium]PQB90036.1 hypothetical protein CUN19_03890 [Enterococcus faecium]PQB93921.1 hypothetical protein CUN11_02930 [Enterococcus faecium]PQC02010.1 hypothetical protein CUN20_00825 [Enterococcus faecium]